MKNFFTVRDVQRAGCTLEPLRCTSCGEVGHVVYNYQIGDGRCEACGEWQTEDEE